LKHALQAVHEIRRAQDDMREQIADMRELLTQARGALRLLSWIAAAGATLAGTVTWVKMVALR